MSVGAPLFTDCEHKTSRVPSLLLNAFPSQRTVSTHTMSQHKLFHPQGDFVRSLVTSMRKVISTVAHVSPGEMSDITEMSSGKMPSFLPLPSSDLWKVRTLMPTHLKKAKRLVKSRAWINSKTLRSFLTTSCLQEMSSTSPLIIMEFGRGLFWVFPHINTVCYRIKWAVMTHIARPIVV